MTTAVFAHAYTLISYMCDSFCLKRIYIYLWSPVETMVRAEANSRNRKSATREQPQIAVIYICLPGIPFPWLSDLDVQYIYTYTCTFIWEYVCGENAGSWLRQTCLPAIEAPSAAGSLRRAANSQPSLMIFSLFLFSQAHKLRSPQEVFPQTYKKYFVNPVSFASLAECIRRGAYQSTEEFLSEVKWIQHNSLIMDTGGEWGNWFLVDFWLFVPNNACFPFPGHSIRFPISNPRNLNRLLYIFFFVFRRACFSYFDLLQLSKNYTLFNETFQKLLSIMTN